MKNPFMVRGYGGAELFCDRQRELATLLSNVRNHADTTLISHRRMGKTGLIMRLFDELRHQGDKLTPIYVDIYASRNLSDLIRMISEAVMKHYPQSSSFGSRFWEFITAFRPTVSFDPITGSPEIGISYQNDAEKEQTLRGILQFLDSQPQPIVLAIHEFQQIREYPEKNAEALLRTHMQGLSNVTFIFCGSKKHMMIDMFSNAGNPFYASTKFLTLGPIEEEAYREFIFRMFHKNGRNIDAAAIDFILEWTKRHTFYTQSLCHSVFASGVESVMVRDVERACGEILSANQDVYLQYRQLITPAQWNFLIAVAKENEVRQATATKFLSKYNIGSPSSAKRLLEALLEKEMLIENTSIEGTSYTLYDVFMLRWMENVER